MKKYLLVTSIIAVVILITVLFFVYRINVGKEVTIGVIASLTGPISPYGERLKEGAELAVDEINQSGGVNKKPIKLIIEDDKSTANDAVLAMKKLIDADRVSVVIGLIGSSPAMAVAPIAEAKRVVLFSTGASTPDFTLAGDYCFRNRSSATDEVKKMAEVAFNALKAKRIAVLYVNNDYGESYKDVFVKRFKELGGEIPLLESFDQGATDMRTQLAKAKAISINGLYLVGQAVEDAYLVRQAKELGIKSQILATIGVETGNFLQIAGDAAEGIIYTAASYDSQNIDPVVRSFESRYETKYKRSADLFAATAYDAINILAEVIKADGYTSEKIKNGLYKIENYPGASGLTTFDKNGDVIKPIAIKKIKNGKFIILNNDLSELK